jgi:hypothetical protein
VLHNGTDAYTLPVTEKWGSTAVKNSTTAAALPSLIDKNYYITLKQVSAAK